MKIDCALLSDAATVREGLLHVLGGGVTRIGRAKYPAPVGLTLALRVLIHPTEADVEHKLDIRLIDSDGQNISAFEVEFKAEVENQPDLEPGEHLSLPIPLQFPPDASLPEAGGYSIEILIDGIHQTSVPFRANLAE